MTTSYSKIQTGEYEVLTDSGEKLGHVVNKKQFGIYGPGNRHWVAFKERDGGAGRDRMARWFKTRKSATRALVNSVPL